MGRVRKPGFDPNQARAILRSAKAERKAEDKERRAVVRRDPLKLEMRMWIWDMRIAGYSIQEIASASADQHFGPVTTGRISRCIDDVFRRIAEPKAEELRQVEDARLDHYLSRLQQRIEIGDPKAIDVALRISKRRMDMWGANLPQRVDIRNIQDVSPELVTLVTRAREQALRTQPELEDAIDVEVLEADIQDLSDFDEQGEQEEEAEGYVDSELGIDGD